MNSIIKDVNQIVKLNSIVRISTAAMLLGIGGVYADARTSDSYSWIPYTNYGYVGANVGRSDFKNGGCEATFSCDDTDVGYKIYTGGQISRVFGVELGYVNIGKFNRNGGDKKAQGADIHLVGNLPLGDKFNVYAKAGGIYGWTSTTANAPDVDTGHEREFNWSYGAGLQFELAQQWALRADWDQYRLKFADGRDNVALYSVGAIYKF
ncbi:MAG TPA: outer membrane beta-barrel protein [Spongiibacteraceae bacterium]